MSVKKYSVSTKLASGRHLTKRFESKAQADKFVKSISTKVIKVKKLKSPR